MSWSPKEKLKFVVFSKKGHKLKYISKVSTHAPVNLCGIP